MKPWKLALTGLALLTIAGCRTDPAVPILERELRLKEDEIYRLRAVLDDAGDYGSSCSDRSVDRNRSTAPSEPESSSRLRRRSSTAPNGVKPPSIDLSSPPTDKVPDTLNPAAGSLPPGVPEVPADIQGPAKPRDLQQNEPRGGSSRRSIERNTPPDADESLGPMLEHNSDGITSRSGRMTMASRSASARPFTPTGDSRHVAAIVLNRMLTGGIGEQAGAGDQGLLVVVEPRDRAGRSVDAPAEMSVVAIDPALEGNAARVARWDFTPGETAALFRRAGSSQSIHLMMTWPENPPVHNKLHLFVRYVTSDGRKLQADQPIEVALPGDKTARWDHNESQADRRSSESVQPNETPDAPHIATRTEEAKPRRPVWSPERR